jgi:hypothetical protein
MTDFISPVSISSLRKFRFSVLYDAPPNITFLLLLLEVLRLWTPGPGLAKRWDLSHTYSKVIKDVHN